MNVIIRENYPTAGAHYTNNYMTNSNTDSNKAQARNISMYKGVLDTKLLLVY